MAGRHERRTSVPVLPCGEGDALRGPLLALQEPFGPSPQRATGVPLAIVRELLIADETVQPEVGDLELQLVLARRRRVGDVNPERVLPEYAEIHAVEPYPCHLAHVTQVQKQPVVGIDRGQTHSGGNAPRDAAGLEVVRNAMLIDAVLSEARRATTSSSGHMRRQA